jgi:hypothetical protein
MRKTTTTSTSTRWSSRKPVGKSISMKRFARRGRGKSTRILKPFSRIRIVVREQEEGVMGQKSNPIGLRLQINRTWDSRWYAEGADYGRMLVEDLKIRQYVIKKALPQAAISKVVIERPAKLCRVSIYAAVPASSSARRARTSRSCARSSAR